MRVVVEAIAHDGYEEFTCLSIWDGTRKLVELKVWREDEYEASVSTGRKDVRLSLDPDD